MTTLDHNSTTPAANSISESNNVEEIKEMQENVGSRCEKKRVSALQAASYARSAVNHVHPHSLSGLTSRFDHTGTNPSYGNL